MAKKGGVFSGHATLFEEDSVFQILFTDVMAAVSRRSGAVRLPRLGEAGPLRSSLLTTLIGEELYTKFLNGQPNKFMRFIA